MNLRVPVLCLLAFAVCAQTQGCATTNEYSDDQCDKFKSKGRCSEPGPQKHCAKTCCGAKQDAPAPTAPAPAPTAPAPSSGSTGSSNFQVKIGGRWKGVCCIGTKLQVSNTKCNWVEDGRRLRDTVAKMELDCPETSGPTDCDCAPYNKGEKMHGIYGPVDSSIGLQETGAPMFSDIRKATCVYVAQDNSLKTKKQSGGSSANNWNAKDETWKDRTCPHFRMSGVKPSPKKFEEGSSMDDDGDASLNVSASLSPSTLTGLLLGAALTLVQAFSQPVLP